MTIQQCKYVIKIAETGSMSEAAKRLFIAQSGLSSSVKQLESELGIRIFERSKGGVTLSYDGAEFLRYARQLVAQSEFISTRYSGGTSAERLYVASQHYDFLADVFSVFVSKTELSEYDLSLRELRTHEVIHDVESAYSDLGFIAVKDGDFDIMNRYLGTKGISFYPLLRAYAHVYVGREHPLSDKKSIDFSELSSYPYISYEQGSHTGSLFTEEICEAREAKKRIVISDRATLMNVLIGTDAYTVGTGIMPSMLNDGRIVCVPIRSDEFYHLGYIRRTDKQLSSLAELFINELNTFAERLVKESTSAG